MESHYELNYGVSLRKMSSNYSAAQKGAFLNPSLISEPPRKITNAPNNISIRTVYFW